MDEVSDSRALAFDPVERMEASVFSVRPCHTCIGAPFAKMRTTISAPRHRKLNTLAKISGVQVSVQMRVDALALVECPIANSGG